MLWYQYQKSGDGAMNLIQSNTKIQKQTLLLHLYACRISCKSAESCVVSNSFLSIKVLFIFNELLIWTLKIEKGSINFVLMDLSHPTDGSLRRLEREVTGLV